eukprot:741558-Pyramimonas_sp.AAC.1
MAILGIPSVSEGASLRLSSPLGVSVLGIGMSSRLVRSAEERERERFRCRCCCPALVATVGSASKSRTGRAP